MKKDNFLAPLLLLGGLYLYSSNRNKTNGQTVTNTAVTNSSSTVEGSEQTNVIVPPNNNQIQYNTPPPADKVLYALRRTTKIYWDYPSRDSPKVFYPSENRQYRDFRQDDVVGYSTGVTTVINNEVWVKIITRRWKQRTFDWVRVNADGWYVLSEKPVYWINE